MKTNKQLGGMLYSIGKNQPETINETLNKDIKAEFVKKLVKIIIDALKIPSQEQRLFEPLLTEVLRKEINNHTDRKGLLQQFEMYVLEKASERFYNELDIPKEITVNHEYANHAKYANIVEYIKDNFKPIKKQTK